MYYKLRKVKQNSYKNIFLKLEIDDIIYFKNKIQEVFFGEKLFKTFSCGSSFIIIFIYSEDWYI